MTSTLAAPASQSSNRRAAEPVRAPSDVLIFGAAVPALLDADAPAFAVVFAVIAGVNAVADRHFSRAAPPE